VQYTDRATHWFASHTRTSSRLKTSCSMAQPTQRTRGGQAPAINKTRVMRPPVAVVRAPLAYIPCHLAWSSRLVTQSSRRMQSWLSKPPCGLAESR